MSQLEDEDSGQEPISPSADFPGEELEVTPVAETFARGFDCVSISSFPGERLIPGKEDTASLVSTATLVPECIYIPPSGYQLVPEQEVTEQRVALQSATERLERATREKECLQEALRCSSEECATQVQVLLDQIKSSEELLQNLQRTLSDTQQKTTRQMATLTATFNRLCQEVNCLNEENEKLRALSSATAPGEPRVTVEPSPTQRAVQHRQERLCIEIVSLQEELKLEQREKSLLEGQLRVQQETHTEETRERHSHSVRHTQSGTLTEIMEATLSSLRTEMERLQQERKQTELQLQESESQVQKLWESVSEQEKCLLQEKEGKICLQAALSEEKTKVSRLQAELGTSEEVQRDFVRLSQALQVSLEKIRQADSMADAPSPYNYPTCRARAP
uniref:Rab GTPase-binding effector protein 2 n=1 Tax=Xenopus tropicalis TaxID=8364 RepID=A0A803JQH2_XENTR